MMQGFLKNYIRYLGLEPAEILSKYNNNTSGSSKGMKLGQGTTFMNLPLIRHRPTLFNIDTFITLLIILALLGSVLFFAYTQYLEPAQAQLTAIAEPVEYQIEESDSAAVVLPTPTLIPTDTPTPSPTPSPEYYTGVAVELVVHERSWVQILADDVKMFEGVLELGDRPNWVGEKRVAIRAGNGGGIEVYVNGQNMGFMGEKGQVIDQVWEKVDEIPSVEPTGTLTPMPEATSESSN
jgi:hypothetical protein